MKHVLMKSWAGLCLAVSVAATTPAATPAQLQALITDERIAEISGLAMSRQHPGILWTLNDSDNPAEVYAIEGEGQVRATLKIEGVRNVDWEDIAVFEHQGRHYILVADVGDNGGMRRNLTLRVVEEPAVLADGSTQEAWSVRFRWPDGPRDCESVAVDPRDGHAYLVSKKRVPPELFRVPLFDAGDGVVEAERIGLLSGIEQPTADDLRRNPVYGRYRSQITAADISRDGRWLAVLNYRRVYLWQRIGSDWGQAVKQPARTLDFPWIPQAEALAFDPDGQSVWIGSERLPAPLLRLPLGDLR